MDRVTRWNIDCPACSDNDNIRLSSMKWYETPIKLIGKRAYRCYGCGARFIGSLMAEALAPRLESESGESPDVDVRCPNCDKKIQLLLTAAEFGEARSSGWYVSCPACYAAFVYHA